MNEAPPSLPADAPAHDRSAINRLLLFFAIVYVVEGLGQVGGLIAQPLSYYLKQEQGWTPSQVSAYLTIFNFPWIIKPIYGVFSDFVPLFGYRRKGYLIAANIVATGAFLWVTQLYAPSHLVWALEATAYAMAISSTVCGAVLVENGQKLGESGRFVNQQWLWFNVAAMASAIGGGALTQLLPPTSALHVAAAIVAVAPLAVLFGAIFLIPEQPARIDLPALRRSFRALLAAFKKRELWIVGLFLFLLLLQPRAEHAALLHHDRRLEVPAGLYRHFGIDLFGRLDRGRAALPAAVRRLVVEAPLAAEHRARHGHDGSLPPADERTIRRDPELLRRISPRCSRPSPRSRLPPTTARSVRRDSASRS